MRCRVAVALAALLATVVLAAGCGGDGDGGNRGGSDGGDQGEARTNDPFYGVISAEPLPTSAELTRIGRGGIGTLRINLAWGYVQAGPDAGYDWSHYDGVVADAARNGIRVLATVYGSAPWAEATPEYPPLGRALHGFSDFVQAAAKRYGADGAFWSEHPELPELPITDWQLWNEPNFAFFWKPVPDPRQYLELLRAFHSAVKQADPEARVLLGGLFPTPRDGLPLVSFLSALYRAGAAPLFDGAALHPYAATPEDSLRRVEQLRALMRRFGDSEKPIWITEVGWASGGQPSGLTVGPERQADYLRQTFDLAASARGRLRIAGVVWYSLNDTPGPLWVGHCGLFGLDGTQKPAWRAFAEVTGDSS